MWLSQRKTLRQAQDSGAITPKKDDGMPDMQNMQKMMVYIFPLMAAWFAYKFPAGVGLYWLIGTIFMIAQQWVANRQAESKKITIKDKAGQIIN